MPIMIGIKNILDKCRKTLDIRFRHLYNIKYRRLPKIFRESNTAGWLSKIFERGGYCGQDEKTAGRGV